ncbi:MAG: exodeoxyribonuclease V subunit gamma [Microthrixaceae bacterium]|nr:exodeoxyribonuclease V subunit gamma [Microthrixaceae bacterium]
MMKVIASERIEPLVADLARTLIDSPADPMTPEWIAVGSEGLQRWLQLELARHLGAQSGRTDGVAANIVFKSPGALRTAVLVSGEDQSDFDPWLADRLTWSVFEALHAHAASDPQLTAFAESDTRSMYQRARIISQRFSGYQMLRPEMVRAWHAGNDVDAAGRPIHDSQAWQPHLWRLVRAHVGTESPAERLERALDAVIGDSLELSLNGQVLPSRLIFFGPSLLPTGAGFLEIAQAVASHREVLTYVIEPSGALSQQLRAKASELGTGGGRDVGADLAANPLLRSWGRLQRETALLLADLPIEVVPPDPRSEDSLLHKIQSDLRDNNAPAGAFQLSPTDASIQIHQCFGPTRQVEALRDVILELVNDPGLKLTEDDIYVVSPALEKFAPLIAATFGACATPSTTHAADGSPLIRYRITGLAGINDNPVTDALVALMDLVTSRFDVTDVADFLAQAAVRNRFRWTEDNVDRIIGWLDDTNVRWGLDGQHRSIFGMPSTVESFTWRTAIDQLLLGAAVDSTADTTVGDVIPVGLAADSITLVGQLASVIHELEMLAGLAADARPIQEWCEIINDSMARLLAPDSDADWQLDATRRSLQQLVETSRLSRADVPLDESGEPLASDTPVTFREVTEQFNTVLGERRSRSDFFRGGVTITTLNALRNVPTGVICILGADQAAFSTGGASGDDLIAMNPRLGDRDKRAEVRQTVLDALLAAKERLILLSDGFDVRTNAVIPHAVVIAELLDTIDQTCAGENASKSVIIEHKLQPFAESYFDGTTGHRSFNKEALQAANARRDRGSKSTEIDWPQVCLDHPAAEPGQQIDLETLKRVLKNPTKVFLNEGLGIRLPDEVDQRTPELPIERDSLDDWKLGTSIMDLLRENHSIEDWVNREVGLGNLPPLSIAKSQVEEIRTMATLINQAALDAGVQDGDPRILTVELDLDNGRRFTARIPLTLADDKRGVSLVRFTRGGPNEELSSWLDLMALTAADDSSPWHAVIVNKPPPSKAKNPPGPKVQVLTTGMTSSAEARRALTLVADIYDTAIRQPVPLFPKVFRRGSIDEPKSDDWSGYNSPLPAELLYVYGDISVYELMDITAQGHPVVDHGAPLAQAYAHLIWDEFDSTVSFVDEEDSDD